MRTADFSYSPGYYYTVYHRLVCVEQTQFRPGRWVNSRRARPRRQSIRRSRRTGPAHISNSANPLGRTRPFNATLRAGVPPGSSASPVVRPTPRISITGNRYGRRTYRISATARSKKRTGNTRTRPEKIKTNANKLIRHPPLTYTPPQPPLRPSPGVRTFFFFFLTPPYVRLERQ